MMNAGAPLDSADDDSLVARIALGDADAFSTLFRRRCNTVLQFALHMTGVRAIAEDVTQDVFLTVIRQANRYKAGESNVTAWLYGIARNHVRHRLRRDRPVVSLDDSGVFEQELPNDIGDPSRDLARAEDLDALRKAILGLPKRYREVVVLCSLQQLSYVDAAAALGCAVGTVRSRLHRGRALLAVKLGATSRPAQAQPRRARCVV